MGRHSLPDRSRAGRSAPRSRRRRRTVVLSTALVMVVAGSAAAALRSGLLSFGASCREHPLRLTVAASPDMAPALRTSARRAQDSGLTSDGRCLAITVRARESSEVATALAAGKDVDAQAWVADSDLWIQRIGAGGEGDRVTSVGNVASTPVGVAMVPAAAKSLGWPKKTYSWFELAGTALQDDSLRLGAADPGHSAAGLLALTQIGTAAASVKGGDTQAAALMKTLSRYTSDTDAQVLTNVPGRSRAAVVSEQASFAHNARTGAADDLRLFYPKDGSPRLDYPYSLLDKTKLSIDDSRAVIRFMSFLRRPEQQRLFQANGFRTSSDDAPRAVITMAGGSSPQPYAEPAPRSAPDSAVEQALGTWTITVQNARITTVVDASASMAEQVPGTGRTRMDVTKGALMQALATFTPEDEIGLWEFSTRLDGAKDYRILVPTGRLGAGDQRDRLSAAFAGLSPVPNGATGLYDTTLAAYRDATASYAKGRFNALVVLTDGVNEDPGSISRTTLVNRLQSLASPERPVPLIMIAVGPGADRREAARIAAATGGSGQSVTDPSQIQSVILKAIVAAATTP